MSNQNKYCCKALSHADQNDYGKSDSFLELASVHQVHQMCAVESVLCHTLTRCCFI